MIKNGDVVTVNYIGKLPNGDIFDSSDDKPLKIKIGENSVIPGFESALIGKKVGDKILVIIKPEDAYGEIREDLFIKVPKSKMPGKVLPGQFLKAINTDGEETIVIVKEVNEDEVIIDANHPLAGKELTFEIEILNVE